MRRRLGRQSPRATALFLVALGAFFSWVLVGTIHGRQHTQDTQHAPTVAGLVTSASEQYHSSRSGHGSYTSRYRVQGRTEAGATWTTTVHANGQDDRSLIGRWVPVKVDPVDSRYAEFPGRPTHSAAGVVFAVVAAACANGAAIAWLVVLYRRRGARL